MATKILLATDASPSANGALAIARELALKSGASVDVLTVLNPADGMEVMASQVPHAFSSSGETEEEMRGTVAHQIAAVGARQLNWPIASAYGPPGLTIAEAAKDVGASIILLGLTHHGRLEHLIRDETALSVVQHTQVPVLAVPPSVKELPRCVVVAIDFEPPVLESLTDILPLLGKDPTIHLAHVAWGWAVDSSEAFEEFDKTYRVGAQSRLSFIAGRMKNEIKHSVETHVLAGPAEGELLKLANRLSADLIVAGSHHERFLQRSLISSVSTAVLRHAGCSVLLAGMDEKGSVETKRLSSKGVVAKPLALLR